MFFLFPPSPALVWRPASPTGGEAECWIPAFAGMTPLTRLPCRLAGLSHRGEASCYIRLKCYEKFYGSFSPIYNVAMPKVNGSAWTWCRPTACIRSVQ